MLGQLGAMLRHLGAMLGHLGTILNHLGAMLGHLGAMLGHLGAMLSQLAESIEKTMVFYRFLLIFQAFWNPPLGPETWGAAASAFRGRYHSKTNSTTSISRRLLSVTWAERERKAAIFIFLMNATLLKLYGYWLYGYMAIWLYRYM